MGITIAEFKQHIKRQTCGKLLYHTKLIFISPKRRRIADCDYVPLAPAAVRVRGPELVLNNFRGWLIETVGECREKHSTCDGYHQTELSRYVMPDGIVSGSE